MRYFEKNEKRRINLVIYALLLTVATVSSLFSTETPRLYTAQRARIFISQKEALDLYLDVAKKLGINPMLPGDVYVITDKDTFGNVKGDVYDIFTGKDYMRSTPDWGIAIAVTGLTEKDIGIGHYALGDSTEPKTIGLVVFRETTFNVRHLLMHEFVHLLIHAQAKDEWVPRWFDEGTAEYYSNKLNLPDHARMALLNLSGLPKLSDIDNLYAMKHYRAEDLYALSFLAVSFLVREYGKNIVPAILSGIQTKHLSKNHFKRQPV
jgi:hypothetical protein